MKKEKRTEILIPLNIKNLNGRTYFDNENLREQIDDFNKRVNEIGVVYGEYDYPESFDTNLRRVSHTISNVRIDDNNVVGDIFVLSTKYGKKLKEDYDNRVFRPRSAGITNENGEVLIKTLFTFDAVEKNTDAFKIEVE